MKFSDIFTSNFLNYINAVSGLDMAVVLLLSLCMGLYILFIYRRVFAGVTYSVSFGVSLLGLSMITSTIILAVSSNVVLSLGMVGALSIVRFRTAIKDPLEIIFLFWAIETGIVLASGLIIMAVISNILIGLVLLGLIRRTSGDPYILILKCDMKSMDQAEQFMMKNTATSVLRSVSPDVRRNYENGMIDKTVVEEVFEVTLRNDTESDAAFMGALATMPGVEKALLVTYNGSYTG